MKRLSSFLLVALFGATMPVFATEAGDEMVAAVPGVHASPEALAESLKAAFAAGNIEAWTANVETSGLSAEDRATLENSLRKIFSVKPTVTSMLVDTLPDGFDRVQVSGGRKYTLTLQPAGVINLKFTAGKSETEIALPYGRVGDGFKLGTLRSEKLAWSGPADAPFLIAVKHTGDADDVATLIRYNASGVALEKRVSGRTPQVVIFAQRIDKVSVDRTGDSGETTLEITHGENGAPVVLYRSEALKAAGEIVYAPAKKAATATPSAK